jgi:hypothetical protein
MQTYSLPYRPADANPAERYKAKTSKRVALLHVLDFRDMATDIAQGSVTISKALRGRDLDSGRHDALEAALGTTRRSVDARRTTDHLDERRRVSAGATVGRKRPINEVEQDLQRIKARAIDDPPVETYAEVDGTRRGPPVDVSQDEAVYDTDELYDAVRCDDEIDDEKPQSPAQYELRGRKEGREARRPEGRPSLWQTVRGRWAGAERVDSSGGDEPDERRDEMVERASLAYDPPRDRRPIAAASEHPPRPPQRVVMPKPISPSRYPTSSAMSPCTSAMSGRARSANRSSAYPVDAPLPSFMTDLVSYVQALGTQAGDRRNSAGVGAHGAGLDASAASFNSPGTNYTEWRRPRRSSPRPSPTPSQPFPFVFETY